MQITQLIFVTVVIEVPLAIDLEHDKSKYSLQQTNCLLLKLVDWKNKK